MGENRGRIQLERTIRMLRKMEISRPEGRVSCGLTRLGGRVREKFRIDRERSRTRGGDQEGLATG